MEIPEIMVEERIDNMINDLDINLQNRGMNLEQYLKYTNSDMNALRQNYREAALINVKTDLVLEAVVKAENLEANPEDIKTELAAMAEAYDAKFEDVEKIVRQQGHFNALVASVLRKKAAQLIIDSIEKA